MHARTRDLIAYGELCGFDLEGLNGKGHYVMRHPNGETVRVPSTPGDFRGDANAEAEMRRKSGITPDRPSAGKYRNTRAGRGFSMRKALKEKNPNKSGRHRSQSDKFKVPKEHPAITEAKAEREAIAAQVAATPYPYLIQELRRLDQRVKALTEVL